MDEESIFLKAVAIEGADERAAFLDKTCGTDAQLRQSVESLLRHHGDAGSFLETPPEALVATIATSHLPSDEEGGIPLDFLQPSDKPGCLGTVGGYEVVELVGCGGMGIVARAYDTKLNRIVAIKAMVPALAANPAAVQRFLREARAAAAVSHNHVVTIHAIEEDHRPPFIVMEFIAGVTLQQKIDRAGPLAVDDILRIGVQMARGLSAAHEQGLVHRDIKPANILLENGVERVKITDFGLARAADDVSVTQTGQIAGTPQYMSPEQAHGDTVDARSDLFSLGSVLYAMCTGRPPFRADTPLAMMRRVSDDTPRGIRQVNSQIPDWLEAIVFTLMTKDPADRFQSAAEVADLLSRHLARLQHPATAARPQPVPPACREAAPSPRSVAKPPKPPKRSTAAGGPGLSWLVVAATLLGTVVLMFQAAVMIYLGSSRDLQPNEASQLNDWTAEDGLASSEPRLMRYSDSDDALTELREFTGARGAHYHVAIAPDSQSILTVAVHEDAARLWNVRDGQEIRQLPGRFAAAAWSPDGKRLFTGTHHPEDDPINELVVWDAESGERLLSLPASTGVFADLAVSSDGRFIASAHGQWWGNPDHRDNSVRVWSLETAQLLHEIRNPEGKAQVDSVAFTPDNAMLLSSGGDGTVRLWNLATGAEMRHFEGTGTRAFSVAVSPDGRFVLAGFGPHKQLGVSAAGIHDPQHCLAVLWDMQTGKEVRRFVGHHGAIKDVAFSPDGSRVVTGSGNAYVGGEAGLGEPNYRQSSDRTMRVWDAVTGQQLAVVPHRTTVVSVEFSTDGRYLVSGETQLFHLWRAEL